MEQKLEELFKECVEELKSININILDEKAIGKVDIKLAKRNSKRYGCCKQEEPDKNNFEIIKRGRIKIKKYCKYNKHHIEISKWVMQLDDKIIKNTIMHEIIHCLPGCNNHGEKFKKYASHINKNLGYNITRLGNKEEDFKKSNIQFKEEHLKNKYKIICKNCGQVIYRQRLQKDLIKKYRCGICGGKLYISQ